LDKPARSVFEFGQEHSEDAYLLIAGVREVSGGNPDAIRSEYHRCAEELGGSVRDALTNMGAPAGAGEAIRMLERSRDELRAHAEVKQKQLERGAALSMSAEDRAHAIENPLPRYLQAKEKGMEGFDREQWIAADRMMLEAGRDQLADADEADSQRALTASVKALDAHLAGARREGIRSGGGMKVLDQAISSARTPDEHGNVISLAAGEPTNTFELTQPPDVDPDALATYNRVRHKMELDAAPMAQFTDYWKRDYAARRGTRALDAPDEPLPLVKLKAGLDVEADKVDRLRRAKAATTQYDRADGPARFYKEDLSKAREGYDLVAGHEQRKREWVQRGIINPMGRVG
jgi:hypothetical protein